MGKFDLTFASAAVLCGGASSRMGFDKSLIATEKGWMLDTLFESLLELFPQVMGVGHCGYTSNSAGVDFKRSERVERALQVGQLKFYKDAETGKGPMAGLLQAMTHSKAPYVFMTACDMPWVSIEHILRLKRQVDENPGAEIVLGTVNGRIEPFQALYRCDLNDRAQNLMGQNKLSLKALMDGCSDESFIKLPVPEAESDFYFNINDQEHLKKYLAEQGCRALYER